MSYADLLSLRSDLITARCRLEFARREPSGRQLLNDMTAAEAAVREALAKLGAAIAEHESDELPAYTPRQEAAHATL